MLPARLDLTICNFRCVIATTVRAERLVRPFSSVMTCTRGKDELRLRIFRSLKFRRRRSVTRRCQDSSTSLFSQ